MELVFEFVLRARLEPPLPFGGGLLGERMFFNAFDGEVEGERLNGKLLPGGGDWLIAHPSGWGVLDVRTQIRTDDGALIFVHYPGLIEMRPATLDALKNGTATRIEDQYFRTTPRFETGNARYAWLNQSLFVGAGRIIEGIGVEYRVHRVT